MNEKNTAKNEVKQTDTENKPLPEASKENNIVDVDPKREIKLPGEESKVPQPKDRLPGVGERLPGKNERAA